MEIKEIINIFSKEKEIEVVIQEKIKELQEYSLYQEIEKLRYEQDNLVLKRININKKIIEEMETKWINKIIEWEFTWEIKELDWVKYIDIQKITN